MKTHVLKTEFVVATQHLCLPVRPQSEWRMPAPNGVLPKMRERFGGLQKIASKVGHFSPSLGLLHRAAGFRRAQPWWSTR